MGRWDVELEGWTRGRHAKGCTILRICSGANPFGGLEVSGIINDDTRQSSMTKFQGQEEVERSFVTTKGKVASFANSAAPGGQKRVGRRGESEANYQA